MLRNISLVVLFVFVSFLTMGAQSRSSAQIAFSSGWAGVGKTPVMNFNIQGAPDKINGGSTGYFNVFYPSLFSATGSVTAIYNSKDAANNWYSVVIAAGVYYPFVNGVQSAKGTSATYIVSMRKMADGTTWEGFSAYNYNTGVALFTTGVTRDGTPVVMPIKGSMTISM